MARSILAMACVCGLTLAAGISRGQTTPSAWPPPNPIRTETPTDTANQPAANRPANPPGSQYPAAQPANYPPAQPGNTGGNRYQPGNQLGTQPCGATDNRNPQLQQQGRSGQPNLDIPTLERRDPQSTQPIAPPPPPFVLTPAEQAEVDQILALWEQKSKDVKTFDSKFVRWEYDLTLAAVDPKAPPGSQPPPISTEQGILKFAAPDKGLYHILYTDKNGKWEPTAPERIEHWMCDGNSIFEWKHPIDPNNPQAPGQVIEYPLPPESRGKAIVDGPLPFLFGAEAQKLRERYYFKTIAATNPQKEIWLDAYPRFQRDAANFSHARLVLNRPDMTPKALQIILPNGKNYYSYEFFETVVNDKLGIFKGNPFQAYTPRGWQKVTQPPPNQDPQSPPPTQAGRTTRPIR